MATIEKRKNGWRAKIRKEGVSESRTFRTKSAAKQWADQREREIEEGIIHGHDRVAAKSKRFRDLLIDRLWRDTHTAQAGRYRRAQPNL